MEKEREYGVSERVLFDQNKTTGHIYNTAHFGC